MRLFVVSEFGMKFCNEKTDFGFYSVRGNLSCCVSGSGVLLQLVLLFIPASAVQMGSGTVLCFGGVPVGLVSATGTISEATM